MRQKPKWGLGDWDWEKWGSDLQEGFGRSRQDFSSLSVQWHQQFRRISTELVVCVPSTHETCTIESWEGCTAPAVFLKAQRKKSPNPVFWPIARRLHLILSSSSRRGGVCFPLKSLRPFSCWGSSNSEGAAYFSKWSSSVQMMTTSRFLSSWGFTLSVLPISRAHLCSFHWQWWALSFTKSGDLNGSISFSIMLRRSSGRNESWGNLAHALASGMQRSSWNPCGSEGTGQHDDLTTWHLIRQT